MGKYSSPGAPGGGGWLLLDEWQVTLYAGPAAHATDRDLATRVHAHIAAALREIEADEQHHDRQVRLALSPTRLT
jgi:hypothetical protein